MQLRFGIRTKLLLSILAILLLSYSTLLYSTMKTLSDASRTEIEKSLEANLKYARAVFQDRTEIVRYSLLQPLNSGNVQKHIAARERAWCADRIKRWQGVLPFLELMVLVDPQKNVIAGRLDTRNPVKELAAIADQAMARKKVVVSTEIVPASLVEGSRAFRPLQGELLMVTMAVPVIDRQGNILGCMLTGDVLNDDGSMAEAMRKVFGRDVEIAVTQRAQKISTSFAGDLSTAPPLTGAILEILERGEQFHGEVELAGQRYETVIDPLLNSRGELVGSISVSVSTGRYNKMRNTNLANILVSASLGIIASVLLALVASRHLTGPMRQLARGVARIQEGDLSQRVEERYHDEVGLLAGSFNKMAGALQERDRIITLKTQDLQELNEQLEKKVTERTRALTMEMGRLEAVLTSMAEGVVVTDADNRVILFNPAAQQMFELVPYRVVGQTMEHVCDIGGFTPLAGRIEEVRETGASGLKEEIVVKGKRLTVHLSSLLDEAGAFAGAVLSIRDVTVEQEVDRMKTDFISTVSHELKTPLTSMKGSLQLLLNRGKWLTDTERQLLTVCFNNTERLIRLIGEILDISGIESGGMAFNFNPVRIGEATAYAVEEIRSYAMGHGITIVNTVGDHLPMVLGDRDRLIQVITNLLSNAVKFSPEGKVVMVSAEHEGNYVTLSVSDRGKVIKWVDREKLFKKFQQIETANRQKVSGTGLGLAICKEIVERHHGRIFYTAAKEFGNTFSFTVPIIEEEHAKGNDTHC
ncbi:ATP-binding protein [Geomesophilobacter sediminis]|uniref:histidine kinase n=1 Tax=Geomesophilobacter sediminis TaxID=2798584 RepID=A0A8J7J8Y2_9BACT|nr:ATP-binding protein [Geomesophilobacter sediminis]MBJ6726191.1 HAMP domain-containing protein [Geomesophilobacter sediminis]